MGGRSLGQELFQLAARWRAAPPIGPWQLHELRAQSFGKLGAGRPNKSSRRPVTFAPPLQARMLQAFLEAAGDSDARIGQLLARGGPGEPGASSRGPQQSSPARSSGLRQVSARWPVGRTITSRRRSVRRCYRRSLRRTQRRALWSGFHWKKACCQWPGRLVVAALGGHAEGAGLGLLPHHI